jgi:hypothetical protein
MATPLLDMLIRQVESLSVDEQLRLASYLVERARQTCAGPTPRYRWQDVRGIAPYPLLGEDAQAWVSRTRQDDTEQRERAWKSE